MISARLALAGFIACLAGCASQGALDSARYEIDNMQSRLTSLEKNLGGIRSESREGLGSIEKNLKSDVGAVKTDLSALKSDIDSLRKVAADQQAATDAAREEMKGLNGKMDDLGISLKKPADDLARYREDADRRIIAIEDRVVKIQAGLDELTKKIAEVPVPPKEKPLTPDALYLKGLDSFKAGDMAAAREIFTKFLEQNPQHDLDANANYWIGETYYSEKNFEPAILSFQEVIKNFPNKEKAPAAMLKQALSFKSISDKKSTKYVLGMLAELYPKSEEAKRAKEMLKELK